MPFFRREKIESIAILGGKKEVFDAKNWKIIGHLGNLLTPLEKLENKWAKLEKLELEILEKSPYRTLEN